MGTFGCAKVYRLGADDIWLSISVRSLQILLPHWLLPPGRGHSARSSHTGSLARYRTGDQPTFSTLARTRPRIYREMTGASGRDERLSPLDSALHNAQRPGA